MTKIGNDMKLMKVVSLIFVCALATGLMSCRSHEDNEKNYYLTPEKMLEKTFLDKVGAPAVGHTWNSAAKRMLSITLPAADSECKISVYTADPLERDNQAIKLAEYDNLAASQIHQLAFEGPAKVNMVYVVLQTGTFTSVSEPVDIDASGNCTYTFEEAPTEYSNLYSRDMEYIIAYEDLGVAVDLDFNDVVLGVTRVSGRNEIKVHLWALGTLIYTYAFFDKEPLFEGRELHDRMGISNNTTANVFSPGNVFSLEARAKSKFALSIFPELQVRLQVSDDFSIVDNVSSFIVQTQPSLKAADDEIKRITVPTKPGQFPYAFLIADPDWCWPTETTSIDVAYPYFADWVNDPTYHNWYWY